MHWIIPDHTGWQIGNVVVQLCDFVKQNFEAENLRRPTRYNFYDWPEYAPGHTAAEKGKLGRCKDILKWPPLKRRQKIYIHIQAASQLWLMTNAHPHSSAMVIATCFTKSSVITGRYSRYHQIQSTEDVAAVRFLRLGLEFDLSLPGGDCYLATFETKAWKLPGNSQGGRFDVSCFCWVSTFHLNCSSCLRSENRWDTLHNSRNVDWWRVHGH